MGDSAKSKLYFTLLKSVSGFITAFSSHIIIAIPLF